MARAVAERLLGRLARTLALVPAFAAALLLSAPLPAGAQEAGARADGALARARELDAQGRHAEALDLLRSARSRSAGTPLEAELLLALARASAGMGDEFRRRWYLGEILRLWPLSAAAATAGGTLGERFAAEGRSAEAVGALRAAATAAAETGDPSRDRLLLRAAELAALALGDRGLARELLAGVDPARLGAEERRTYPLVLSRARWESLPTSAFGLVDPNVSALALDADDLWVGTWNGGLARYARAEGVATVFSQGADSLVANTVRAICVTARHVWVGTDQGLSQYSKALSRWRTVPELSGPRPAKVQALLELDGVVWAATLGDGLWAWQGEAWRRVAERELPTAYLTCLGAGRGGLLVGSMDHGFFLLERAGSVAEVLLPGGRGPRNVTALREDSRGTLWIASYGEGLWEWPGASAAAIHHDSRGGRIGDDWVMCIADGGEALYFGTFGGGVSAAGADGAWRTYGLGDGLAGLDVTVATAGGGSVWFGTLGAGVSVYHEGLR